MAERLFPDDVGHVLLDILGTEISPELVPAHEGEPIQSTQARIGPYALQDFTLWHVLRRGSRPSRIAFLAERAWADPSAGAWPPGLPEEERVGDGYFRICGTSRRQFILHLCHVDITATH